MSISKMTGRQIAAIVVGCYAVYGVMLAAAYAYSPMVGKAVLYGTQPWLTLF